MISRTVEDGEDYLSELRDDISVKARDLSERAKAHAPAVLTRKAGAD
jgi:hypothetical protein